MTGRIWYLTLVYGWDLENPKEGTKNGPTYSFTWPSLEGETK